MFHRACRVGCGVLLIALAAVSPALSQPYQVIDLGVLPGQTASAPSDINNALQVVGLSGDQAFVWDPVDGMRALAMTRSPQINNSGIIAGVRASGGHFHVVAIVDGVEYVLPSPPDTITDVRELTDNNLLLLRGARTWAMAAGQFFDLTTLFGGDAFAINEQGMVGGANASGAYLRPVTLTWQASPGALEYIVEAGRLPGRSELFDGSVGDVTSLSVTVPPGRYHVRLRAGNAVGVSAPTTDIIVDVP